MPEVVVMGGGVVGLATALLLARDGHGVTVIERDPAPPLPEPDGAWRDWQRRGVGQFRQLHYFQPRFRAILEAELPDVVEALERVGALRFNQVDQAPVELSGGTRPGDEAFTALTARRPVMESVLARLADDAPGVTVRRGTAVTALLAGAPAAGATPHVAGVTTADGRYVRADLVIDASGRRSPLPALLADVGAAPPCEEREDCGFIYYGRHFASEDGSIPHLVGATLQDYGSISALTLPADNGTWGIGLITSARDVAARALRDTACWTRVAHSLPAIAHWLDGHPLDENVVVMAKIEDRHRSFSRDGAPIATGLVAVGDAWACTNPSIGRGASIGLLHAQALRDLVRTDALDNPATFADRWSAVTEATVEPWYRATLNYDRHRLAEIEAAIQHERYEPGDPAWNTTKALACASNKDGDLLRARLRIAGVLNTPADVLADPGIRQRVLAIGGDWRDQPPSGPDRTQLLSMLAA